LIPLVCACDPKSYRQCSHKRPLDINEHEKATDHLTLYYSDQLVKRNNHSYMYNKPLNCASKCTIQMSVMINTG